MSRHALVLAAGKGTRFYSDKPKVLQELAGRPLICHLLDKLGSLELDDVVVVVGHGAAEVKEVLSGYPVRFVLQAEQQGTGHAVQVAAEHISASEGSLLILYGDTVLISEHQLARLLDAREASSADVVLLTNRMADPTGYGRILRDDSGAFAGIVEEVDADESQRAIQEVNPGFYCFSTSALSEALPRLSTANEKGEYYLTDVPQLVLDAGGRVETLPAGPSEVLKGVNDRRQLAEAEEALRRSVNSALIEAGVILVDPDRTYIDARAVIEPETTVFPGVIIEGKTTIGRGTVVRANAHLADARIGSGAVIDNGSIVRDSSIGARTTVGPFAHVRQGSSIGADGRIGNFVEVKNSTLGVGTKAAHLSYLGDATIGERVNIGAGTITCNYDGSRKSPTTIGDETFIGSNTQLIAPVTIGSRAYVAAGSTITEDVPDGALAIARSRQVNKAGWRED